MIRKIKRAIRNWWKCRTKRCDYYRHFLAYGNAELTHEGFHAAERLAAWHFKNCQYNGPGMCRICTSWEQRLRA